MPYIDQTLPVNGYHQKPLLGDAPLPNQPLHDVKPQGKFSLIFGNEATGLPHEFSKIGKSVIIPHSDRIDSLNLPIAASIAMYEATKADF